MIELCEGREVLRLIEGVIARPDEYRQIDLCAPFIDGSIVPRLLALATTATTRGCGVRIVTSGRSANLLLSLLPGPRQHWRRMVISRGDLHAKAYLATGRGRRPSEAIVTSANLTGPGVDSNIELGVRATPTTEQGRRLIGQVRNFISRITVQRRPS